MRYVFFLGGHDLEMLEIKKAAEAAGCEVRDKNLDWSDAKASAYREEILDVIHAGNTPVLVELERDFFPTAAVVVDHHNELAHRPASIMQVLELLGLPATRWLRLVAANDRAYIPGMLEMGAIPMEINAIRSADRAAQGITQEHETEADRAIFDLERRGNLRIVRLSHNKWATVADRLFAFWPNGRQNLVVVCVNEGELYYFGRGDVCAWLKDAFGGFNGGAGLGNSDGEAFWGCDGVDEKKGTSILTSLSREVA